MLLHKRLPESFNGIYDKLPTEDQETVVRTLNYCLLSLSSEFYNLEDGFYELVNALNHLLYRQKKIPRTNLESYFS